MFSVTHRTYRHHERGSIPVAFAELGNGVHLMHAIDPAATAWLLASTALVLLMTPGLAIFYGGMVRTTGVLNMIMMSFISIPLVTVAWLLVGYTLAFSKGGPGGCIGGLSHIRVLRHS